ncbi:AAA family ATPase [Streptomyces sp. NPDC006739]|uniref:AAA family ATPase n=1 Tax=Streptomyces sp. NPDC006739 TaxID=3364763 RepID=UPI0036B1A464
MTDTTPTRHDRTRLLARTFATRLEEVKQDFVERDDVVDMLALATLCREHALLIGPPGTAKTRLIEKYCRILDTSPFTYLLTRFTEPAELFGPIDLRKFQDESVYEVNTSGMLPEARIAFLDEVFQGSSAILNTLLTLVNERNFFTGSKTVHGRLITLLGSSNEIPDDPVLAAFSDRFLFRCRLDYVGDNEVEEVLGLGWREEQQQIRGAASPVNGQVGKAPVKVATADRSQVVFPLADLAVLQQALADIDLSAVRDPYARIVRALRAEGIAFSDRRAVKAQKAFAASALLAGRLRAEVADLAVLSRLWTDPRDEQSLRRIVADHDVPLDTPGRVRRDPYDLRIDLRELRNRLAVLRTCDEIREVLRLLGRLATEARRDHPAEQPLLREIGQAQRETLTKLREDFPEG